MKQYELTVLLKKDNKEGESHIEALLKGVGIKKVKANSWGVKPLAYPIKKQTEAIYVYFEFEAEPKTVKEIEQKLNLNETILRNLLVIA
jgi:small subunit ribosomal protein S6